MQFEWDENKNALNKTKHGVSFEEAQSVFNDPLANIFDDIWNSVGELCELIIGRSHSGKLLVISFTERVNFIRLISALSWSNKNRHPNRLINLSQLKQGALKNA